MQKDIQPKYEAIEGKQKNIEAGGRIDKFKKRFKMD